MLAPREVDEYVLPTERRVIRFRRHWAAIVTEVLVAVGLFVVLAVAAAVLPPNVVLDNLFWYGSLLVLLKATYKVAEWWVEKVVITDKRVMLTVGDLHAQGRHDAADQGHRPDLRAVVQRPHPRLRHDDHRVGRPDPGPQPHRLPPPSPRRSTRPSPSWSSARSAGPARTWAAAAAAGSAAGAAGAAGDRPPHPLVGLRRHGHPRGAGRRGGRRRGHDGRADRPRHDGGLGRGRRRPPAGHDAGPGRRVLHPQPRRARRLGHHTPAGIPVRPRPSRGARRAGPAARRAPGAASGGWPS